MCNKGRRQSPINVEPDKLLFDPSLRPLHIDKHKVVSRMQIVMREIITSECSSPFVFRSRDYSTIPDNRLCFEQTKILSSMLIFLVGHQVRFMFKYLERRNKNSFSVHFQPTDINLRKFTFITARKITKDRSIKSTAMHFPVK